MNTNEMRIFDEWNAKKKIIHNQGVPKRVRSGQIWWTDVGKNIGFEQNGGATFERPILIIRRINYNLALGLPLTSQVKNEASAFYYRLTRTQTHSIAVIPQLRVMSTKRMRRLIESVDTDELAVITRKIREFFRL